MGTGEWAENGVLIGVPRPSEPNESFRARVQTVGTGDFTIMVVFHHIPKTGGMAILANIALCNPKLRILKRDSPFKTNRAEPYPEDLCDLLHGHFAYEKIPPSCVKFTFARHPIARLSSSFYSLRQRLRDFGITSIKEVRAPVDIAFAGGARLRFAREQLFFLHTIEDFIDAFLRTQGTFNLGLIPEIFTPDYRKHYDFIGVTERMNESIARLGKLVKTDASRMTVVNVSNSGEITYRVRELEAFYGEEIETYRRVLLELGAPAGPATAEFP